MPAPFPVRLVAHDPAWGERAEGEAMRLRAAAPPIEAVHHIGSTAVPGLVAKPVIDLLPVATSLVAIDASQGALEAIGYDWHGAYGIEGRRYLTRDDPVTGRRDIQLHVFAAGDPAIRRHLAFRELLRRSPAMAAAYAREKTRCAARHPEDSHAYGACKAAWIAAAEREALARCRD